MAYKIVVDAGHGGCTTRKRDERVAGSPETGRTVSFTVEREFSEQPVVQVLERITGLLLEQWNNIDREKGQKE